ncbi:hypothetical protein KC364_g77 [Hortaea werneckii]|nr:hypothetical protein KC364_g77 [Hortaea werneckii]
MPCGIVIFVKDLAGLSQSVLIARTRCKCIVVQVHWSKAGTGSRWLREAPKANPSPRSVQSAIRRLSCLAGQYLTFTLRENATIYEKLAQARLLNSMHLHGVLHVPLRLHIQIATPSPICIPQALSTTTPPSPPAWATEPHAPSAAPPLVFAPPGCWLKPSPLLSLSSSSVSSSHSTFPSSGIRCARKTMLRGPGGQYEQCGRYDECMHRYRRTWRTEDQTPVATRMGTLPARNARLRESVSKTCGVRKEIG